eukprot:jgi/Botrbrau1/19996/Bobra.200_1s0006.1
MASKALESMMCYSPFAFASKELESAFQRDLPRRAGSIVARYVILYCGLTAALTSRMFRNPNSHLDGSPAQILIPACGLCWFTTAATLPFAAPNLYSKYWTAVNTVLRLMISTIILTTWESMPPEPVQGPLTLGGGVLSYFIGVLTPSALVVPGSTPLPLLLHIPAQAALLWGLFMADSKLCSMRLASPDLPGQVDSLVKLITGLFPMLQPVFQRLPSHNCVFVVSFGQAFAAVAGTGLMVWQEISLRKAFLAEDTTARLVLERCPPQRVAKFPYGHPKGVVLFLCILCCSAIGAAILWEAFVFHTLWAAA